MGHARVRNSGAQHRATHLPAPTCDLRALPLGAAREQPRESGVLHFGAWPLSPRQLVPPRRTGALWFPRCSSAALFLTPAADGGFRDGGREMAAPRDHPGALEKQGREGRRGGSGVEVVFPPDPAAPAPLCPHGGSVFGPSQAAGLLGRGWLRRALGF